MKIKTPLLRRARGVRWSATPCIFRCVGKERVPSAVPMSVCTLVPPELLSDENEPLGESDNHPPNVVKHQLLAGVVPIKDAPPQGLRGARRPPRNYSHGRLIDEWDDLLGGRATDAADSLYGHHRSLSGSAMVCRICEERVDLQWAEQHTRRCVLLSRCKQDAIACDAPLQKLDVVLLDKIAERKSLRQLAAPRESLRERVMARLWRETPERSSGAFDDPLLDTAILLQAHEALSRALSCDPLAEEALDTCEEVRMAGLLP